MINDLVLLFWFKLIWFNSNLLYKDSIDIEDLNLIKGSITKFNFLSISVKNKKGFSLAIFIICFKKFFGDSNPVICLDNSSKFILLFLFIFNRPKDKYPSINFNLRKITFT